MTVAIRGLFYLITATAGYFGVDVTFADGAEETVAGVLAAALALEGVITVRKRQAAKRASMAPPPPDQPAP